MSSRVPVDGRDLEPGAVVEVLDAAELWFPAQILSVSPAGVKVHFRGWDRAWDDFVPAGKYATNLCRFRGWGESVPDDYRRGEIIEALDLTGVWLKSRVLAVSESLVKVHYLGWHAKWDEWIHRTAGRLQRLAGEEAALEGGPSGKQLAVLQRRLCSRSAAERRAGPHDLSLNEELCSVCYALGELVCCEGQCLRAFHADCVERLLEEVGAPPVFPEARARAPRPPPSGPPLESVPRTERVPAPAGAEPARAETQEAAPAAEPPKAAPTSAAEPPEAAPAGGDGLAAARRGERASLPIVIDLTEPDGAEVLPASAGAGAPALHGVRPELRPAARCEAGRSAGTAAASCEAEAGAVGEVWVCPDCTHGVHRCSLCGEVEHEGELLEPPFRCAAKRPCGRFFHPSCLASAWTQFGPACPASDAACARGECPAHVCFECGEAEDGRYGNAMCVCYGCGCGLHRCCIPPGSSLFSSETLGHGLCADCAAARSAAPARARGAGKRGARAPAAERLRGLVPFRFAPLPLLQSESDSSGDDEEGGGARRRAAHARRDGGELSNLELREAMRCSSDIGYPWRPLRFRRRLPQPFELPADILAELREGACDATSGFRPPPYRHIARSVWRTDRTEALERMDLEPCACRACGLGCADGCLNRQTRHECSAATCSVGEARCANRRIQRGHFPPLHVFKTLSKVRALGAALCCSGAHAPTRADLASPAPRAPPRLPPALRLQGWGVRAVSPIARGEIVIEYVGEVIDREEWELRTGRASQHEAIYFMQLSSGLILDAAHKGNVSRFINHSCAPNLQVRAAARRAALAAPPSAWPARIAPPRARGLTAPHVRSAPAPALGWSPQVQKWFVNCQPRLAMFALRDIGAREELSYDYNVQWTGSWQSGQRCQCGAPNCTGKLSALACKKAGPLKPKPKRKRRRHSLARQQLARLLAQPCRVCAAQGDDECTLLCDGCDGAFHLACLSPALDAVPDGEWHCPACAASRGSELLALGSGVGALAAAGGQSVEPVGVVAAQLPLLGVV